DPKNIQVLSHGAPLRDGAWMLIKVVNESVYGRARTWEDDSDVLQVEIGGLMDQVKAGLLTSTQALAKLMPSGLEAKTAPAGAQSQTLGDRVIDLQSLISHDNALSKSERTTEFGKLTTVWALALAACK